MVGGLAISGGVAFVSPLIAGPSTDLKNEVPSNLSVDSPQNMSTVKQIVVNCPVLKVSCTLGEGILAFPHSSRDVVIDVIFRSGPLYDATTSTLHFVDISESRVCNVEWLPNRNFHVDFPGLSSQYSHSPIFC